MVVDFFLQNFTQNKTLVRTFLMLAEHFPGPCGPFVVFHALSINLVMHFKMFLLYVA